MKASQEEISKLEKKLDLGWYLPKELFVNGRGDIYDFTLDDYNYFLDNVSSCEKLVEGLKALSPLADDALRVARRMSQKDFDYLKKNLPNQREGFGMMPRKYRTILIPRRFVEASFAEELLEVPAGTFLIRKMELEAGYDIPLATSQEGEYSR